MAATLRAGADKVAVNTAAVARPELLAEAAAQFGSQCVVLSIDARRDRNHWVVVTHGGRAVTTLDAIEWARRAEALGAGEVLVTSIDRDGTRMGYDLALTQAMANAVSVPVIASGGAGEPAHLAAALMNGADAVLVAGMLHRAEQTVTSLKRYLAAAGVAVRGVKDPAYA
jgi:cyclase